jgi:hypothetical protein
MGTRAVHIIPPRIKPDKKPGFLRDETRFLSPFALWYNRATRRSSGGEESNCDGGVLWQEQAETGKDAIGVELSF